MSNDIFNDVMMILGWPQDTGLKKNLKSHSPEANMPERIQKVSRATIYMFTCIHCS